MDKAAGVSLVDATRPLRAFLADHPRVLRAVGGGWRGLKRIVEGPRRTELQAWFNEVEGNLTPSEWRMLTQRHDDSQTLPPTSDSELSLSNPRLLMLRDEYAITEIPVTVPSLWDESFLRKNLVDLRYFRGDSAYVWGYREWPRAMILKYFIFTGYVEARDPRHLVSRLGEDGAFGCWTFRYPGHPPVSRDLLDSVNEIMFLHRHLGILDGPPLRVLDIGAGYGRLAHRMTQATGVDDYCCVDAIAESTFLSEHYLSHRGCKPPARVVPLHELGDIGPPGSFDLAINIHSFSECAYETVRWWLEWLGRLDVPNLLIVPNDRDELLAYEADGSRRDFRHLLARAGYELSVCEPVIDEPAVRDLLQIEDRFMLFRRTK